MDGLGFFWGGHAAGVVCYTLNTEQNAVFCSYLVFSANEGRKVPLFSGDCSNVQLVVHQSFFKKKQPEAAITRDTTEMSLLTFQPVGYAGPV